MKADLPLVRFSREIWNYIINTQTHDSLLSFQFRATKQPAVCDAATLQPEAGLASPKGKTHGGMRVALRNFACAHLPLEQYDQII